MVDKRKEMVNIGNKARASKQVRSAKPGSSAIGTLIKGERVKPIASGVAVDKPPKPKLGSGSEELV
jgi:hypothetical protein